jgi:hypothetical protein
LNGFLIVGAKAAIIGRRVKEDVKKAEEIFIVAIKFALFYVATQLIFNFFSCNIHNGVT